MSAAPGGPGPRREVGGAAESGAHPPHVTANDRGAPVQDETQAPNTVPAVGANAHGFDKQTTHDQPRSDESMYDGRPGEDKDRGLTDSP